MKKILWISLIIQVIAVNIFAAEYILYGEVYNYDGTSGTAETPNSFASINAYREGISGQIGHQHNGENTTYPEKIYAAAGINPAYFLTDVGSSDWSLTPPAAGQVVICVVETGEPQNGWAGDSYTGCTATVITSDDILNSQTNISPVNLVLIPVPSITEQGTDYIKIGWVGLSNDFITGYTLYRSDDGGFSYNPITVIAQAQGSQIIYTDNDPALKPSVTYYYKIAVNFLWGGGGGAPSYYETNTRSKPSSGAQIFPKTFTPTASFTSTPTFTETFTFTFTETFTSTLTETATLTFTETATFTYTFTYTITLTSTPTFTITATATYTPSLSPTNTQEIIPEILVSNIKNHKIIILNNPVKQNKIKIGLYSDENGKAEVYMYNLRMELVDRYVISVITGSNIYEYRIKNNISSGTYVLFVKVNNKKLPVRKIAVIK